MITVDEARKRIEKSCRALGPEEVVLAASLGRVTAADVFAPVSLPSFDNSAMDGFVFASAASAAAAEASPVELSIGEDLRAGDAPSKLERGTARRIMTGAPIPPGADTVIEKEKAEVKNGRLVLTAPAVPGRHVRRAGEELQKGKLAVAKGSAINPGTIGFLAAMGVARVSVYRAPKVSLLTTGSELVEAGAALAPGQIYDSNRAMLAASLEELRIRPVFSRRLPDVPKTIQKILHFALGESDVVILTGGVSAGEYDFVRTLLDEAGARTVFWKVNQKPGKPIWFGVKGETLIFGLPGNPASVFTCFYEYVYPAIRRLLGHAHPHLPARLVQLKSAVKSDPGKLLFLKGRLENGGDEETAVPLGAQHSHMLSSLCEANALIVIPESSKATAAGDAVIAHALPGVFETRT